MRRDTYDPGSAEAVAIELRHAQLLESLSRVDEAAESFRRALAHAPESREATAGLERVLRSSIDASGLADFLAEQAAAAADEVDRDRALLERAVILEELLDRPHEAQEVYQQLARSAADTELRLDASLRYERLLESAGEWSVLRQHLESALGRASEEEDERLHERLARLCGESPARRGRGDRPPGTHRRAQSGARRRVAHAGGALRAGEIAPTI